MQTQCNIHIISHRYGESITPGALKPLGPRQHGRHSASESFICIFLNEDLFFKQNFLETCTLGSNYNKLALVQIMTWHLRGGKLLSEPMKAIVY